MTDAVFGYSLPDRASRTERVSTCDCEVEAISGDFPGLFNRDDIRDVALRELGITEKELHFLLNDDARRMEHWVPMGETILLSSTFLKIFRSAENDVAKLTLAFGFRLISTEVLCAIDRLFCDIERAASVCDAAESYAQTLIRHELERIVFESAKFELNLAIERGFLQRLTVHATIEEYGALLRDPDYLAYLVQKYPLLPLHINRRLLLLLSAIGTFIHRLEEDLSDIVTALEITSSSQVARIDTTLGDSHAGASRVATVTFSSGQKVVYKPREVQGEAAFQRFLSWANRETALPEHRTLWVLDRPGYGWMEFVDWLPAGNEKEVRDYYVRYGSLIALIHSIAGTDIHFENLVASASQPIAIDLETIVQPMTYAKRDGEDQSYLLNLDYFADTPLFTAMFDPVFLTKSLSGSPLNVFATGDSGSVELYFDENGTLCSRTIQDTSAISHSVLRLGDCQVRFADHIDDVLEGYRARMTDICLRRSELLSGVLEAIFGKISVRVVFRYTRQYVSYVSAIYSPYCMESFRNTEELLSSLWQIGQTSAAATPLVASEYRAIWNGDVPYFVGGVNEVDVRDCRGQTIRTVLERSGLEAVKERLLRTTLPIVRDEIDLLEYSLRQCAEDLDATSQHNGQMEDVPLKGWRQLSAQISRRILVKGERVLYVDPSMNRELKTSFRPLGNDFATGLAGVAFGLAYASKFDDQGLQKDKARALAHRAFLRDVPNSYEVGICTGMAGHVYLASHLAVLWNEPYFLQVGEHLAQRILRLSWFDRHFDIYSGLSGAVLAIDSLMDAMVSDHLGSDHLDPLLDKLVGRLADHSISQDGVTYWASSIPSVGASTGFAHGVSGIAYALLRAFKRIPSKKLEALIIGAERFIHSCYRHEDETWAEDAAGSSPNMQVWCHGVPGIANFYYELARIFPSTDFQEKADASLRGVVRHAVFENDSICHGTLGNIDLLLTLCRQGDGRLGRSGGLGVIEAVTADLADRPAQCGNERKHENVSFLTGLSGMAYQQLRMEKKGQLPSVTLFEGPRVNGY